jgi:transcriptional regulator with XRE-family HTH domain
MRSEDSQALVQLALDAQGWTQKELAMRLSVSPTQISKWRAGERMSTAMDTELRSLSGIGDMDPLFVLSAGSLENAQKWEGLIRYLADDAQENAETDYDTEPLGDDSGRLAANTFSVLRDMGVAIPTTFPRDLDIGGNGYSPDEDSDLDESVIDSNPISSLIRKIFLELNNVYGFYAAYIFELVENDELDLDDTAAGGLEHELLPLAASKVSADPTLATQFSKFRWQIRRDMEDALNAIKIAASRCGVPLRAELMDMVYLVGTELANEVERESFGYNKGQLHPDIYMNELLCGMRAIHQILPLILKKLDIDFTLDASDLRAGGG